jgi:hypothetical protein
MTKLEKVYLRKKAFRQLKYAPRYTLTNEWCVVAKKCEIICIDYIHNSNIKRTRTRLIRKIGWLNND